MPKKPRVRRSKRRKKVTVRTPLEKKMIANPPHLERGEFLKMTITIPPSVYAVLAEKVNQRRLHKKVNATKSAIVREALVKFLT